MQLLEHIRTYINSLDEKNWNRLLLIILGSYLFIISCILFFYYYRVSSLTQRLDEINEARATAQKILTKARYVQKQRAEVNALLEEEPDFQIKQYMQEAMIKTGIINNITSENDTTTDREDNYREIIVRYHFSGINMKQLTQLLDEIEQNKRLFTKDLEITKSKKIPNTIDVGITVATMIPKPKP